MPRIDKATNLSLLFKFILSERLSNSLRGYYNFVEFIMLLYTFLAIFLLDTKNI